MSSRPSSRCRWLRRDLLHLDSHLRNSEANFVKNKKIFLSKKGNQLESTHGLRSKILAQNTN